MSVENMSSLKYVCRENVTAPIEMVYQMTVDEMSVYEMTVDKMPVYQMTVD